ncbi:hypothetical protein LTR27_007376 [Elasticomyces elasticus]|nr:hypothetical protein LTR27_007376 [Elasticomyces elasticus]
MSSAPLPTWGEGGILQWREDHTVTMNLDDEANLRDLMARLHTPLLQQVPKALVNRYSLYREYCFGEESSEIVRKYLDSGVSKLLADRYLDVLKKGEKHSKGFRIGHILIILAAGVLSHGATLPIELKNALPILVRICLASLEAVLFSLELTRPVQLKDPAAHTHPLARQQMQKALLDFVQGTPYDFGNETMDESRLKRMLGLRKTKLSTHLDRVFRETTVVSFEGETPNEIYDGVEDVLATAGPPENVNMGFNVPPGGKPDHTTTWQYNVCGGCGKKESAAMGLLLCGRCKERKYCSKECQKRNFKYHKVVCSRPEEVMAELKGCLKEGVPIFMPKQPGPIVPGGIGMNQ